MEYYERRHKIMLIEDDTAHHLEDNYSKQETKCKVRNNGKKRFNMEN